MGNGGCVSTLLVRLGFVRALRLRSIGMALIGASLVLLVLVLSWKNYEEYVRVRELGGFAASVVREQSDSLLQISRRRLSSKPQPSRPSGAWKEDAPELAQWLVTSSIVSSDPGKTLSELKRILRESKLTPSMHASMERWSEALGRWSKLRIPAAEDSASAHSFELLDENLHLARSRYFEAIGYEKIGRGYDASVLYLWVIDLLVPFTQRALSHPQLPEALFLLGAAYFHLRSRLPEGIRGDRILNLCLEVFPETVWAGQAGLLWRNWMIPRRSKEGVEVKALGSRLGSE